MKKSLPLKLAGIALFSTLAAILYKRVKTLLKIRHIGGKLYKVDYAADYKLEKLLSKGVKNTNDLISFMSKEMYMGYPIKINEQISGCTSFSAVSPDGKRLVGRNFDYPKTGMLLVRTKPRGGYASYSMVCLSHINVMEEAGTMPETMLGKLMILCAPYACVDGMNEKGLHVSVLELQTEPTAQETGKTGIITTVAVRMLLDKCATTDEAVRMLGEYDMHSSAGSPYHFFITDAVGNSVVVAWPQQEMAVTKVAQVTNFQLADGKDKGMGMGHDRYKTAEWTLGKRDGVLDEDEAMKLLGEVGVSFEGRNWGTLWSIVYNIDELTLSICTEMDYATVYKVAL